MDQHMGALTQNIETEIDNDLDTNSDEYNDENLQYALLTHDVLEPTNLHEALNSNDAPKWRAAMDDEIN